MSSKKVKGKKVQLQREAQPEPVIPKLESRGSEPNGPNEPHGEPTLSLDDKNSERIEEAIVWENFLRSGPNPPSQSKKKSAAYCVFNGRETGIFETWAVTETQVEAFPNARYKKYPTVAEAEAAWNDARAKGAIGPLKPHPGESTTDSNSTSPKASAKQSTSQPDKSTPMSPGGPFVSCYVVVRGDRPGVYQGNEAAVNAMGNNRLAHRIQVASMQEGAIIFTEQYMDGKVVSLGAGDA